MDHEGLLRRHLIPWAEFRDDVRGVAELGSRSGDQPADEWADLDLLLLVDDPSVFLDSDDWLSQIAPHWVALKHPGPFADLAVRQVLFSDALDFDIVPIAAGTLQARLDDPAVAFALAGGFMGGFRPLVDKDGELAGAAVPPNHHEPWAGIDTAGFSFFVNDFLFQVVWVSKHLRRGEVWACLDDVNCYMKSRLVQMIEWHTLVNQPQAGMRTGGRHLEDWADPRILDRLGATVPRYDAASIAGALLAMVELFGDVARDVAANANCSYPENAHTEVLGWARGCLSPLLAKQG